MIASLVVGVIALFAAQAAGAAAAAGQQATPPGTSASAESADATAIRTVLDRYRTAFNKLDAKEVKAVWPTVDEQALSRAFRQLARQSIVFTLCDVDVTDARGIASCAGRVQYVPQVGSRTPRDENRHWNFALRRGERDWTIESVFVR